MDPIRRSRCKPSKHEERTGPSALLICHKQNPMKGWAICNEHFNHSLHSLRCTTFPSRKLDFFCFECLYKHIHLCLSPHSSRPPLRSSPSNHSTTTPTYPRSLSKSLFVILSKVQGPGTLPGHLHIRSLRQRLWFFQERKKGGKKGREKKIH